MPGPVHEGLVAVLANFRTLPFELARLCGAQLHGAHSELRPSPTEFQDPGVPGKLFHADWVIVAWAKVDGELTAVDGLAVEVQLTHEPIKLISWIIYRAGVRSRHRCRAWTLVLSPNPSVRQRARELFEHEPELCPWIIEPESIPAIVDLAQARRELGMALIATVMHARGPNAVACGRATIEALYELSPPQLECYLSLVTACLTEDQMSQIARQLPPPVEEKLSEFERQSSPFTKGLREGRQKGRQEGRQEGRHAACEAMAAALLTALAQRGLTVEPAQRARIHACHDAGRLSAWLLGAAVAPSVDELLD